MCIIVHCSSQGREDGKTSKSRKPSSSELAEKSLKRKEGSKSMDSRLMQLSVTVLQDGDGEDMKDVTRRKTEAEHSSRGNGQVKNEPDRDKVGLTPPAANNSGNKDRGKAGMDSKHKLSGSKYQHKTKDSAAAEKDKSRQQKGRKSAGESGKKKQRTESTSSASSDSSSSSSTSSSGTSSSGSSSSTSSSSSAVSSPKKQRQRKTTKSKSDAQQSTSRSVKTHQAKDATKSTDKLLESGKPSVKDSNRRPREKLDDDGQKEHSFHGGGSWKEDNGGRDRHRMPTESRKEKRHERGGREKKDLDVSPRRLREDDVEQEMPGSDRRLPQDSAGDYRQDRVLVRYTAEQHRRSGRYETDEHYERDRLQHPVDFEVSDRYRTGQRRCSCRCSSCCGGFLPHHVHVFMSLCSFLPHSVYVLCLYCVVFCPTVYMCQVCIVFFSAPSCTCVCIIVYFSASPCTCVCAIVVDQHDEGHLQYADDRRRLSDVGARRDRRGRLYVCRCYSC